MSLDKTRTEPKSTGADRGEATFALYVVGHPDATRLGLSCAVGRRLVLGRGAGCFGAGTLADDLISREHAEVRAEGDGVVVMDRGSHNGTWVNGARVDETVVTTGDAIRLGSVLLLVCQLEPGGQAAASPRVVGVSHALGEVLAQLRLAAPRDVPVLLLGETGVGKEVFARELHHLSGRTGSFVAVNCGNLAEGVLQSELFGHVDGAFSGTAGQRGGLIAEAEGGTLFLDEIGDAPRALQVALLRLLEHRAARAVGADRARSIDVRFVAATHRDLRSEGFRPDLAARLHRWVVRVPPLRDHAEDIGLLATHFAREAAGRDVNFDSASMLDLVRHRWPDNVRGLQSVATRAAIEAGDAAVITQLVDFVVDARASSLADKVERPDAARLVRLLEEHRGNVRAVADAVGVSRNSVYRWLRDEAIDLSAIRSK